MEDAFYAIIQTDRYSLVVVSTFAIVAFCLIREIITSTAMAMFSAPVMFLGGLIANHLFRSYSIIAVNDKDTNVVVASAVGILSALILMLLLIWLTVLWSERRSKKNRALRGLPLLHE